MKKLSLTALAAFVLAFATTSSAEVVRAHKGKNKNQAQIVPVAFASTSAPASSLAGPGKGKAKKQKESAAATQMFTAPAISTVTTVTKKHRGPGNAAVTGVSPLFLPVANVTPTLASVNTLGVTAGNKFKKNVVNTPQAPSLAAASITAVPEPPYTSLMLMGLFGAAIVMARRYHANSVAQ